MEESQGFVFMRTIVPTCSYMATQCRPILRVYKSPNKDAIICTFFLKFRKTVFSFFLFSCYFFHPYSCVAVKNVDKEWTQSMYMKNGCKRRTIYTSIVVKRRSGIIQRDDIASAETLLQTKGFWKSREVLDDVEISFLFPPTTVDGSTANAHGRSAGNSEKAATISTRNGTWSSIRSQIGWQLLIFWHCFQETQMCRQFVVPTAFGQVAAGHGHFGSDRFTARWTWRHFQTGWQTHLNPWAVHPVICPTDAHQI